MSCLNPIWIHDKSRNEGGTEVPCGKCYQCLQQKRSVWTYRILQELRVSESAYFVTLTYNKENIPYAELYSKEFSSLFKPDLQKFLKRLRWRISKDYPKSERWAKQSEKTQKWSPKLRYFACGEYGKRGDRPHYHLIMYNLPNDYVKWDPINEETYSKVIEEEWNKGFVHIGKVERGSAHYVAKYTLDPLVNKWNENDVRQKPFAVMSRKPGIGNNYTQDEKNRNYFTRSKNSYTVLKNGIKQPLGRYLKEKIYTDERVRLEVNGRAKKFAKEAKARFEDNCNSAGRNIHEAERFELESSERKIKRIVKNNKL